MAAADKRINLIIDAILQDKGFQKKIKGMTAATKTAAKKQQSFIGGIKKNWLAVAAVIGTVWITVKKALDLNKEFTEYKQGMTALARNTGQNADTIIAKLKEVSKGTVANKDLMLAANRAVALNVTKDVGKMANLLDISRLKAKAMGIDTTQAFNDLVTGIGRASPKILDNLGIITKGWADEARAAGVAYDQQFILNKILQQGNVELKAAGASVLTSAEKMKRFSAAINNAKVSVGGLLSKAILPITDSITEWLTANRNMEESTLRLITLKTRYRDVLDKLAGKIKLVTDETKEQLEAERAILKLQIRKELEKVDKTYKKYNKGLLSTTKLLKGMIILAKGQRDENVKRAAAFKEEIDAGDKRYITQVNYESAVKNVELAVARLAETEAELGEITLDQTAGVNTLAQAYKDQIITEEDLIGIDKDLIALIKEKAAEQEKVTKKLKTDAGVRKKIAEDIKETKDKLLEEEKKEVETLIKKLTALRLSQGKDEEEIAEEILKFRKMTHKEALKSLRESVKEITKLVKDQAATIGRVEKETSNFKDRLTKLDIKREKAGRDAITKGTITASKEKIKAEEEAQREINKIETEITEHKRKEGIEVEKIDTSLFDERIEEFKEQRTAALILRRQRIKDMALLTKEANALQGITEKREEHEKKLAEILSIQNSLNKTVDEADNLSKSILQTEKDKEVFIKRQNDELDKQTEKGNVRLDTLNKQKETAEGSLEAAKQMDKYELGAEFLENLQRALDSNIISWKDLETISSSAVAKMEEPLKNLQKIYKDTETQIGTMGGEIVTAGVLSTEQLKNMQNNVDLGNMSLLEMMGKLVEIATKSGKVPESVADWGKAFTKAARDMGEVERSITGAAQGTAGAISEAIDKAIATISNLGSLMSEFGETAKTSGYVAQTSMYEIERAAGVAKVAAGEAVRAFGSALSMIGDFATALKEGGIMGLLMEIGNKIAELFKKATEAEAIAAEYSKEFFEGRIKYYELESELASNRTRELEYNKNEALRIYDEETEALLEQDRIKDEIREKENVARLEKFDAEHEYTAFLEAEEEERYKRMSKKEKAEYDLKKKYEEERLALEEQIAAEEKAIEDQKVIDEAKREADRKEIEDKNNALIKAAKKEEFRINKEIRLLQAEIDKLAAVASVPNAPFSTKDDEARNEIKGFYNSLISQIEGLEWTPYAMGTNALMKDTYAKLHQGERVVPAALNIPGLSNEALIASAIRGLAIPSAGAVSTSYDQRKYNTEQNSTNTFEVPPGTVGIDELMEYANRTNSQIFQR